MMFSYLSIKDIALFVHRIIMIRMLIFSKLIIHYYNYYIKTSSTIIVKNRIVNSMESLKDQSKLYSKSNMV